MRGTTCSALREPLFLTALELRVLLPDPPRGLASVVSVNRSRRMD